MKAGTRIIGQLIADERFLKGARDMETYISAMRSSLKTAVYNTGIEIYTFGDERLLDNWEDQKERQIRQSFELILSKPLTKNQIYQVVNEVRPQPLTFKSF